MYIFNSGIKFDRNLFRVPAVTHVCFYSIFLYVYLRVFAFGLFFISLQYYTESGCSTRPVVLVHVCGPEYTCISLCVSACVPCVWQRALLRTGRSDCDISSTLTLHTTHLHFANSPRLTLQLFSLSFPFSPLTFPVSLSSSLSFSLSFSCQSCQSFWWRVFELRLRMLTERFLRVSEETRTSAGQRKLITD